MTDRFDTDGWLVVPGLLDPPTVGTAAAALDTVFDAEADVADERGWHTDTHRVAYALPVKHPDLLAACLHPAAVSLARSVLGDDCVLAGGNGLDVPPGSRAQDLHRDHPVPTPGTTLYLHVVCALDPFTEANGATRVVTGSQRDGDGRRPVDREDEAEAVALAAGDAVAFDGSLVHAAGANRTTGRRRALHLFFARPWVQPHWDFPASFPEAGASALTAEHRQLLGFGPGPRRWDRGQRRVVR